MEIKYKFDNNNESVDMKKLHTVMRRYMLSILFSIYYILCFHFS